MSSTRLRSSVVLLALVACACSATARGIGAAPTPAPQPSVTTDVGWQSSVEMGRLIAQGYHPPLNEKGFTVFAVRHGSSPRYPMSAIVADMRRAVRFIRQHAGG
jgi:hypothetical protein